MLILTNNQYHLWLKSAANMKLLFNASVLRIRNDGLTNFQSFFDFNRNSIESLSKACSNNIDMIVSDFLNRIAAGNAVPGTNISTILFQQLVVATNVVKYYRSNHKNAQL